MTAEPIAPLDPAALADEVRDLAHEAHRVLRADTHEAPDIHDLSRRVAHLQDRIRGHRFDELACWLDNVRQIIEAS